jgi:predicted CoA-binding protein
MDERLIARYMLDLEEETGSVPILDATEAAALLRRARRIAIVGASADPARPSHSVMRYLQHHGYECVPVNPNVREVLGVPAYRTLTEAVRSTGQFDIVDVFRRPEYAADVAAEAAAVGARSLWLQLGVVNWEAAQIASDAGMPVVMDRCTAMDHRAIRERDRAR